MSINIRKVLCFLNSDYYLCKNKHLKICKGINEMTDANLKLWYLKNLGLFKGAKSSEMKFLDEITVMKNYNKKEYIYFSKEDIDSVYIVKKGNVEIGYLDESGKEFSIDILGMGEIFGTVLGQGGSGGYARSIDRSLICHMSRVDFEEFFQQLSPPSGLVEAANDNVPISTCAPNMNCFAERFVG